MADMTPGALLEQTDDPIMKLLLQQMLTRQEEATDDDTEARLRAHLRKATRLVQDLRAEAAAANEMVAFVARVLGACVRCWGLDRFCRECLGAGVPGSRDLDATALLDWVGPALIRAGVVTAPFHEAPRFHGAASRTDFARPDISMTREGDVHDDDARL
jgi:hypothetical protein